MANPNEPIGGPIVEHAFRYPAGFAWLAGAPCDKFTEMWNEARNGLRGQAPQTIPVGVLVTIQFVGVSLGDAGRALACGGIEEAR